MEEPRIRAEGHLMVTDLDRFLVDPSRRWHLEHGNAGRLLAALPDAVVDAVITDPPYSSGGQFRSDRMGTTREKYVDASTRRERPNFLGDNRDQRGHLTWCWLWLAECMRVAKPGAPICLFTDWRQLPLTTDALQAGGWIWRGIVPWDKTEGCRPRKGGFAAQCEYIVWGSNGPLPDDRGVGCLPGFVRAFLKPAEKYHQAGKPIDVMRAILQIVPPGGLVLDPFAGSATTGVACLREGRRFLGAELAAEYAPLARERLTAEEQGVSLQHARAGQLALPRGRARTLAAGAVPCPVAVASAGAEA